MCVALILERCNLYKSVALLSLVSLKCKMFFFYYYYLQVDGINEPVYADNWSCSGVNRVMSDLSNTFISDIFPIIT